MQSQQELYFCCAAVPPWPTAALALKELLLGQFCETFCSLLQWGLNSRAAACGLGFVGCLTELQMLLCFAASSLNRTGGVTPGFIPANLTGMSTRPVPCRASPVPPPRQVETSSKVEMTNAFKPSATHSCTLSGWTVRRIACWVDKGVPVRNTRPEHLSLLR